ncbi:hypothetical protein J437_LFUL005387 [Ladona fulva]|uniref:ABC1 atypical kinase-like domain-containing protein n=1 Tax=Ladona fulva TaxID=123851 RepID=A0A8K0K0J8_LADFU|nr:hypothetical protein J437_LFUL005387 [Ladona fulva]
MSRHLGTDLLIILKGLDCVIKQGIRLEENRLRHIWLTSSIRTLSEELCQKSVNTGKEILNDPKILQNSATRIFTESVERSSVVLAGIKEVACYASAKENILPKDDEVSEKVKEKEDYITPTPDTNLADKKSNAIEVEEVKMSADIMKNKNYGELTMGKANDIDKVENGILSKSAHYIRPEESSKFDPETETKDTSLPKTFILSPKDQQEQLSSRARQRRVPASRLARLVSFGGLAAGLGFGTAAEFARRTIERTVSKSEGKKSAKSEKLIPSAASLFLTQANAERIVNTLCKVRGAALKIGQILSIQDNNIVSPELQKAFERVRQAADFMPTWQVKRVMVKEFGPDWESMLTAFEETPFAAASIGQVHLAMLHDGRQVAMKIQYPGVAEGIESDIDNLVSILKVWNIFPEGFFIDNVVKVAKRELAWEVDYVREAECAKKFKDLLRPYPEYLVPSVIDELSTKQVYTTELVNGIPIDKCAELDQATRDHVCLLIMRLCLKELFEFLYMQTDPNWSNFFYDPESKKLALLDFGATRSYEKAFMDKYILVIKAAADGKRDEAMQAAHVDAVMILGEVFGTGGFDFGAQNTTLRLQRLIPTIVTERLCPPPEEIYSLHRKLSGVFLLCAKLRVTMNCRILFEEVLNEYKFG